MPTIMELIEEYGDATAYRESLGGHTGHPDLDAAQAKATHAADTLLADIKERVEAIESHLNLDMLFTHDELRTIRKGITILVSAHMGTPSAADVATILVKWDNHFPQPKPKTT